MLVLRRVKLLFIGLAALLLILRLSTENTSRNYEIYLQQSAKRSYEISPEPSAIEIDKALMKELPNIPFDYWTRHKNSTLQLNATCARKPNLLTNAYFNNYWQTFRAGKITLQLFGAYYDNRTSLAKGPLIRILAMGNSIQITLKQSFCQLWFDEQIKPVIVPVRTYKSFWPKQWGTHPKLLYPQLLSCQLPPPEGQLLVPKTVSLVSTLCATADNNLRVSFELPPVNATKRDFPVCVKGLDFPYIDISARVIEWLELLRLLGVQKVYTYKFGVHPNLQKVLDYYVALDFLEVRPLSLATGDPILPHFQHLIMKNQRLKKRLNELIPYNDCFYRNMYKYKYIALLDVDEVIMPLGNLLTWQQLVDVTNQRQINETRRCPNGFASICFCNVHFSAQETDLASNYVAAQGGLNKAFYMLYHVARSANHSKPRMAVKCLHSTAEVETLHNHYPRSWLKSCGPIHLKTDQAQMQHYRINPNPQEGQLVLDANMWRWKDKLLERGSSVLKSLGLATDL